MYWSPPVVNSEQRDSDVPVIRAQNLDATMTDLWGVGMGAVGSISAIRAPLSALGFRSGNHVCVALRISNADIRAG